ncbi:MAG: DUF262 domain-containing HNH endonuclease family protein [bacterium]
MKEKYDVSTIELEQLFTTKKIRCSNQVQRDFLWDVEDALNLLNDIINEKERYYGLNSMGFTYTDKTKESLECFDGQQRLTTYTLMIKSFIFFIEENIDNTNTFKNRVINRLSKFIYKEDADYNKILTFIPNDGNQTTLDIYEKIIKIDEYGKYREYINNNKLSNNKHVKIIKNFYNKIQDIYNNTYRINKTLDSCYRTNELNKTQDELFLTNILNSIIRKPIIIQYIGDDEDKYNHFTNQSKGKDLTPTDFLKNEFNKIDNKYKFKLNEFIELFESIKYISDPNGNSNNTNKLLGYLIFLHNNNFKIEKVNKKTVKNLINKYNYFNDYNDIETIIKQTEIYFDICNIKEGNEFEYLNLNSPIIIHIRKELDFLYNKLSIADTWTPLIIYLFHKYEYDYNYIYEYLKLFTKFSFFIYIINKNGNNDIRNLIIKICKEIENNEDVSSIKNILLEYINTNYDKTIKESYESLKDLSNFKNKNFNKKLINYILYQYYDSQENNYTESISYNNLSLEHVIPKKYEKNYEYLSDDLDNEYIDNLIHSFGNQILLNLNANKKIGNKSINDKLEIYKESKFIANKNFINDLINNNEINYNAIIRRHNDIIDFMYEHFKL